MIPEGLPYWRLSAFYFFYFGLLGAIVPFWGLYLQSLGFSALQIGYLGAILMGTKIVAPNLWGWLGDRLGQRLRILQVGCLLAIICFLIILFKHSFAWVALSVALFSFFWNAVLPQFEVVTLAHLGNSPQFYSRIRVWGSIGFVLVVLGLGLFFDVVDIRYLPWVMLFMLCLIWFSSLSVSEKPFTVGHGKHQPLWQTICEPHVLSFLVCVFLLQVSHGSYYTFYSVYLEALSYSRSTIGVLWALGVVAEVLVFLVMHRVMHRYSLRQILLFSLSMTVVRWWLIGCYADSAAVLIFAQGLHAFSFGCCHAVAIEFVRRHFHGEIQGQGQALYTAASFGAGGAVGAFISGLVWALSPVLSFALSALFAALALLVVWLGLRGDEFESKA
ncbi:MAG: major facilitator superfamily domain-containing protein 6 [Candidatus Pelagadaptatus aseana]|uniref:MFS transporter n=1 Tax=Candidatus Pelagadaptatus aseana TaxID=3120508 RepID=UPI0039B1956B